MFGVRRHTSDNHGYPTVSEDMPRVSERVRAHPTVSEDMPRVSDRSFFRIFFLLHFRILIPHPPPELFADEFQVRLSF